MAIICFSLSASLVSDKHKIQLAFCMNETLANNLDNDMKKRKKQLEHYEKARCLSLCSLTKFMNRQYCEDKPEILDAL